MWVLVTYLGVYDVLAKALVLAVAVLVYFTMLRQYIFAPAPAIERS
jgi:ABC-type bacteriocin/lantibiotic exporter with double-glycine peptidase domain